MMTNTSAIRQQAAHTAYQLLSLSFSTRAIHEGKKKEKKIYASMKKGNIGELSDKKDRPDITALVDWA